MNSEDESLILNKEYPPIFGLDKLGKIRVWKATVFMFPVSSPSPVQMNAMAVIQHGIYDGKLQVDTANILKERTSARKMKQLLSNNVFQKSKRNEKTKSRKKDTLPPSPVEILV